MHIDHMKKLSLLILDHFLRLKTFPGLKSPLMRTYFKASMKENATRRLIYL